MQGYLRKFRTQQDAAILINEKALAEWPVSVVKEALDVTGRKIIQDGTGRFYLVNHPGRNGPVLPGEKGGRMINRDYAYRDRQQLIRGVIARMLMDDKREAARKWLDRLPQRPYQPEVATVLRGSK